MIVVYSPQKKFNMLKKNIYLFYGKGFNFKKNSVNMVKDKKLILFRNKIF